MRPARGSSLSLWAVLATIVGASATSWAGGPNAEAAPGTRLPAAPADLSVLIARHGIMTRAHLEGRRLVARDAGGAVVSSREIAEADRRQLLGAARAALDDDAPQWSCPVDETFVSVTLEARTTSSAVCPERNNWRAHPERWRALIALLRRLLEPAR